MKDSNRFELPVVIAEHGELQIEGRGIDAALIFV